MIEIPSYFVDRTATIAVANSVPSPPTSNYFLELRTENATGSVFNWKPADPNRFSDKIVLTRYPRKG